MTFKTLLLATFLVGVAQAKPNGPHKDHPWMKIACMGQELSLPPGMNETMKTCHKQVFGEDIDAIQATKTPSPEMKKKGMCMMVCQAQKMGVMDASIKVDEKKAVQILEEEMKVPKEAMDKLKPSMGKCVTDFGSGLKVTDDDCSSVEKLVFCLRDTIVQTCMPELAEMIKKMET